MVTTNIILLIIVLILVFFTFLIMLIYLTPFQFFKKIRFIFRRYKNSLLSLSEKKQVSLKIAEAARELSELKSGALIVIEKGSDLKRYIDLGVIINSDISIQLMIAIFDKHSPIHDGAIIIKGNKIICTSAYLPSTQKKISSHYGSRHRAAIGLSEITDALTIIVSETTGQISYTQSGSIITISTYMDLINIIYKFLVGNDEALEVTNNGGV